MPSFIINHGVMRESELKALLRKAKVCRILFVIMLLSKQRSASK